MFTEHQIKELEAPLSPKHVKKRTQSGRSLSYVEGWHAISEANRIFGFDAWCSETIDIRCVSEGSRKLSSGGEGHSVSYIARVRITVGTITRDGVGAGHGIDRDLGLAHESAIKEAETDARKRALMTFGNPFGLALYDKEQTNVADPPRPPSKNLLDAMKSADGHTTKAELRNWLTSLKSTFAASLGDEYPRLVEYVTARAATLPENNQTTKDAA